MVQDAVYVDFIKKELRVRVDNVYSELVYGTQQKHKTIL